MLRLFLFLTCFIFSLIPLASSLGQQVVPKKPAKSGRGSGRGRGRPKGSGKRGAGRTRGGSMAAAEMAGAQAGATAAYAAYGYSVSGAGRLLLEPLLFFVR